VAGWWGQYIQGYSARQAILILLTPLFLIGLIYLGMQNLAISQEQIIKLVAWCIVSPQAYILSLIASIILIVGLRKENNFVEGLYWVTPNLSGRKLSRWRKIVVMNGNFIAFSMVFSLLLGIYYVEVTIAIFAVMFSFALSLTTLGFVKYLFTRKLLW
ncbi:MAG: hypothetical protein ACHP9Y_04190, partial [Gammaproteobacteria bacterium]